MHDSFHTLVFVIVFEQNLTAGLFLGHHFTLSHLKIMLNFTV